MTLRGVWPWGIQIGPFAVHKTYFFKINFPLINKPHAAFPFSCMQRNGHPSMYPKSEWHQGVYDPGAFELDRLQSIKPIFERWNSTLLTSHMQLFPFPACREMDTPQCTPTRSGPGTSPAWFLGSAQFAASSSSCSPWVFNSLAWKPLHMVNLT